LERLTVEQFHRMLDLGILREGTPLELIDGLFVRKDRSDAGGDRILHGPRHALAIKRWQRLERLFDAFPCHLQCQLPVTLSHDLEPEPDGAIIRGKEESYGQRHPGPADILLVCEIGDSSLEYDRTAKQRFYAAASIPVYWIVNIQDRCIEVYDSPTIDKGRQDRRRDIHEGESVPMAVGRDEVVEIPVVQLLR
jgi:hypothetical protein